jgi:hypothetical protein
MADDILIPLSFFAAVTLSLYFYFRARNRERLAMIEKGKDLDLSKMKFSNGNKYWAFKLGLFFIGIALGALMGNVLETNFPRMAEPVAYISMIFLFGGIALVIGNLVKFEKEKE